MPYLHSEDDRHLYAALDLPFGAAIEDVEMAFQMLSQEFNPEIDDSPSIMEEFKEITRAYHFLMLKLRKPKPESTSSKSSQTSSDMEDVQTETEPTAAPEDENGNCEEECCSWSPFSTNSGERINTAAATAAAGAESGSDDENRAEVYSCSQDSTSETEPVSKLVGESHAKTFVDQLRSWEKQTLMVVPTNSATKLKLRIVRVPISSSTAARTSPCWISPTVKEELNKPSCSGIQTKRETIAETMSDNEDGEEPPKKQRKMSLSDYCSNLREKRPELFPLVNGTYQMPYEGKGKASKWKPCPPKSSQHPMPSKDDAAGEAERKVLCSVCGEMLDIGTKVCHCCGTSIPSVEL